MGYLMDWWSCRWVTHEHPKASEPALGSFATRVGWDNGRRRPPGALGAAAEADDALTDEEDVVADEAPEGDRVDGSVQLRERI